MDKLAFIIWTLVGCVFIGMGIYCFVSKRKTEVAFGFWANANVFPVENCEAYNRAVGKLWIVFGIVFLLLGLPLLAGQNSGLALIPILGIMIEAIAAMVVYVLIIEKKYRKK